MPYSKNFKNTTIIKQTIEITHNLISWKLFLAFLPDDQFEMFIDCCVSMWVN